MVHRTLEQRLDRAAAIWKWQCVIRSTALIFSIGLLVLLAVGVFIERGWITQTISAFGIIALTLMSGAVAWLVKLIFTLDRRLDRPWLAAAVEQEHEELMDRFNAAVELENRPHDKSSVMFREAIEQQASKLLRQHPDRGPFSWFTTVVHVGVMLMLALGTLRFYDHFQPFQLLAANEAAPKEVEEATMLEIPEVAPDASDPANSVEGTNEPWGQVRISDPGRNLRITRHEDVPLLIEAAADRPLAEIYWATSVNRDTDVKHALPQPDDPRYGVFQPTLSPAELGLADWDLAVYRAVAVAEDARQYESQTYFVEIIPSRDQLDQLSPEAYEQLENLSELIQQQQQVVLETEPLQQASSGDTSRKREALAEQENRIATSTQIARSNLPQPLPADLTQSFDNEMRSAVSALRESETSLKENDPNAALEAEQNALMHLVDARRHLSHLVRNHREAFEPSTAEAIEQMQSQGATPADPEFARLLERLDEQTRDTAAAAERLNALARNQQQLVDQVRDLPIEQLPSMSAPQTAVQQQFQSLQEAFPTVFRDLTTLSQSAEQSLRNAADRLRQSSDRAKQSTEQARDNLQNLADELNLRQLANEIAQANTLQQRLERNRDEYQRIEQQPDQTDALKLTRTTDETRELVQQLQQLAASPSPSGFDSPSAEQAPLAEHLSPEVASQITGQCDAIGKTDEPAERSKLAQGLGQSLEKLADALAREMASQGERLDEQQFASQLQQMQDRNESLRSARESVQQALQEQRSIQSDALNNLPQMQQFPQLAQQQLQVQQQMQQAMEQHAGAFEPARPESQSAQSAMRETAQALNAQSPIAPELADQAAQQLERLDEALASQQQQQGMSEQQSMQKMLEHLQQRLDQMASSPEKFSQEQKQLTAGQCKSVGSKACEMAGQSGGSSSGSGGSPSPSPSSGTPQSGGDSQPTGTSGSPNPRGETGQPSGESAPGESGQGESGQGESGQGESGQGESGQGESGQGASLGESRAQQLAAASDRLATAQGDQPTSEAARDLQRQLQDLAEDLASQQPGSSPGRSGMGMGMSMAAGGQRSLRASGRQAIERGLAQLESAARLGNAGQLTPQSSQSLQRGGVADILAGMQSEYGYNESSRAVAIRLSEQLKDPQSTVDPKTLQQLREQIQSLQQDLSAQSETESEPETTRRMDPNRFPPDYRESIQKYFETLSEER